MKIQIKYFVVFLYFILQANQTNAQCKCGHIKWIYKMLKIRFEIKEPQPITYVTGPSSVYEIPFSFNAYCSFVKANNKPYFYLWTNNTNYKSYDKVDYQKGDPIKFYLAGGKVIESNCYSNYPGIKSQTISFYQLKKEDLDLLSTTSLDSLMVTNHFKSRSNGKENTDETQNTVLRFSKRNIDRFKNWSSCLRQQF